MKNFVALANNTVKENHLDGKKKYFGKYPAYLYNANQVFFIEQGAYVAPWDIITSQEVEEFKSTETQISIEVKDSVNRYYA